MVKPKSRAQQIADMQEPIVKDFDPEEDAPAVESDDDSASGSDNEGAATEHYVAVGKSKLRKADEAILGPKYAGSRVSREALYDDEDEEDESSSEEDEESRLKFADPNDIDVEVDDDDQDIDSDNAFGASDDEKFKKFSFRGSSNPKAVTGRKQRPTAADFMTDSEGEEASGDESDHVETDEDVLDIEAQHGEEDDTNSVEENSDEDEEDESGQQNSGDEDEDNDGSEESEDDDDDDARRAELRKIMNEEQKTVVATISQAAKADADKGKAVLQQRKVFDSLLGIRMNLQKGLVATNSMAAVDDKDSEEDEAYQAAEDAAIKLWNTLDGLRHQLIKASSDAKPGQKRKRDVDSTAPASSLWERMQASEVASIDLRQRTLEKWWGKVKGSTAPLTGKLNNNITSMSLTSVIQDQLAKPDALDKTKRPRSCAPAQEKLKIIEDPNIYDDTTLYKTLLNQFVEQRKSDLGSSAGGVVGAPAQWVVKEAKMRKTVDTKASKGRKMRYNVHEKLQNFMAPEDRATWEPEAVDRFFGSLLGQKMNLGEDAMVVDDENSGTLIEGEGLRLF